MKILMISPQPFFESRGTPISVYQRLEALSQLGYEVDLLTYHLGEDINIPNVQIFRIPNLSFIKEVKIGPSWVKLLLDILLFFKSIWILSFKRYDVIHSHEEAAFFSNFLADIFQTRHVYDMHSVLSKQLTVYKFGDWWLPIGIFQLLERYVISSCSAIIAVGNDLEIYINTINQATAQVRIENLPYQYFFNGANHHSLNRPQKYMGNGRKVRIVYTGSFEPYQGLNLLLESAVIVHNHFPNSEFILVGATRSQLPIWRDKIKSLQMTSYTTIIKNVHPNEAVQYISSADILVSPRKNLSTVPSKIYSYLYSGKPIVATDVEAHSQFRDKDLAILVKPEKNDLARGIMELLNNPEMARQMGQRGLKFVLEKYNYNNYIEKVERIYCSLSLK